MVARAFPQIIEEGKLYMVEPPLFSFKENGKKRFVSTNREMITYLQEKFSKNNDLYRNGTKMSTKSVFDFLYRNERYNEYLKRLADKNICSSEFIELVVTKVNDFGITKSSISKWNPFIKESFSPQLKAEWHDGHIIIYGIKNGRYEDLDLDEYFISCKETRKLIDLMAVNLNVITGYNIYGSINKSNLTIHKTLEVFENSDGREIKRFKGLGQMSAEDLQSTCLDVQNQRSIRITSKDVTKSVEDLGCWHSAKDFAKTYRREFMAKYEPDIQEIST